MDLLTITDPEHENVWSLGITISPNKRVENWEQRVGEKPAAFKIVSIGDHPQTKAEETAESYGFDPEPHFVTIPDAGDLTQIGVKLTEALEEWDTSDHQTVICFHSVGALLQYTSVKRVFQFLNTFATHVGEEDAVAHYHMDPNAHENSTVAKLIPVFDALVEVDAKDNWQITIR